jgi:hypothetical protein
VGLLVDCVMRGWFPSPLGVKSEWFPCVGSSPMSTTKLTS